MLLGGLPFIGDASLSPDLASYAAIGAWFIARVLFEFVALYRRRFRRPGRPGRFECERCHDLTEVNVGGAWVDCPTCVVDPIERDDD